MALSPDAVDAGIDVARRGDQNAVLSLYRRHESEL